MGVCVGVWVCVDGNMDDQDLNEPQNRSALLRGNHENAAILFDLEAISSVC